MPAETLPGFLSRRCFLSPYDGAVTDWPALPLNDWRDTKETLNRWMQIVGKITLELRRGPKRRIPQSG